ncbi:MAG: hypothetical protein EBX40_07135 [Gammaproteobacteria bacterium]|nr:hypothetical protein [Gammaproteobacteria bacterium]
MKAPSLYKISEQLSDLLNLVNDNSMPKDVMEAAIDAVALDFKDKALGIAAVIRQFEAMAKTIHHRVIELESRQRRFEDESLRLRGYLLAYMEKYGHDKIENDDLSVKVRLGTGAVEVVDSSKLPAEYWRLPPAPEPQPDKKKIADDIKQGVVIDGVQIVKKPRLEIK